MGGSTAAKLGDEAYARWRGRAHRACRAAIMYRVERVSLRTVLDLPGEAWLSPTRSVREMARTRSSCLSRRHHVPRRKSLSTVFDLPPHWRERCTCVARRGCAATHLRCKTRLRWMRCHWGLSKEKKKKKKKKKKKREKKKKKKKKKKS